MRDKEEEVVMMMKERKLDILGVAETRYRGEGRRVIQDNYQIIYKGREEDTMHGVGFVISAEVAETVIECQHINERIITLTMSVEDGKVVIIQVYAPQQGRDNQEKDEFYDQLQMVYDRIPLEYKVIIIGDLNGHVGVDRRGIEGVIGSFGIGDKNEEGERIIDFCVRNELAITNTFFKHQESHKWTWYGWNNEANEYTRKSMIDMVIARDKRMILDTKSIPSISMDSDHRLVVAKIRVKRHKPVPTPKYKRLKIEKLREGDTKEEFKRRMGEVRMERENVGAEERWEDIKEEVLNIAEEVVGFKSCGGTKKHTQWWTEEVKTTVKNKNKTFRKWMKVRNEENRREYVEARNLAERIKREAKRESWRIVGQNLAADYKEGKRLIYSIAKNYRKVQGPKSRVLKSKEGEVILGEQGKDERWREYFSDLLNVEYDGELEGEELVNVEEMIEGEGEITMREVEEAIKKSKNGKAAGGDGIPAELIKEGGDNLKVWLKGLYNEIWRTGKPPKEWTRSIICPIFKKGDKTECKNYRGISLLTHVGKMYEGILERRLRAVLEDRLGEWQYGFRPGRSIVDLVFSLRMVIEKAWEWDRPQYIAFIDLEKAFDCIPREKLWKVLEEQHYQVPAMLLRAIKGMYWECESRVRSEEGRELWFNVKSGVRQGSGLSPLLFIIYMDRIMREVCRNEEKVTTFGYADDVGVVAESEEDLQREIDRWVEILRRYGMKMNVEKSEVMLVARTQREVIITVEGQRLKVVTDFKYLGVNFNNEGEMDREINSRIGNYSKNLGLMIPLLKEREIPREVKKTIYTTILRPILTFGSEAWKMTKRSESKITAAEMRCLRMIKGVTRMDRVRNTDIRMELGVESVVEVVQRGQLRWYGHVMRMEEHRYPARFLRWTPVGRRPRGRPRKRWKENVEKAVIDRGRSMEEIEDGRLYEDRDAWRRLVMRISD